MITTEINGKTFEIDGKDFLSPAEELTLEDWLLDMRAQDAARKRFRSTETVNSHRKHLREKTNQHSAAGVLAYCLSRGFIKVLSTDGFKVPAFSMVAKMFGLEDGQTANAGPLERYAKRATDRAKQRAPAPFGNRRGAEPTLCEPATGDSETFEVPAYLRQRVRESDFVGLERMAAYANRLKAFLSKGEAA